MKRSKVLFTVMFFAVFSLYGCHAHLRVTRMFVVNGIKVLHDSSQLRPAFTRKGKTYFYVIGRGKGQVRYNSLKRNGRIKVKNYKIIQLK